jgi:hypothetical protein
VSNIGNQIAATMFKAAPGGFVFREPYRWVFGPARHFLVSETQKAQIAAVLISRRPILSQVVMWTTLCLMVAVACVLVWAINRHDNPSAGDVAAIIVLTVVQVYAGLLLLRWRQLRRLQPLLAGASLTDERITRGDVERALSAGASALSVKQMVVTGTVSVIASTVCAMNFILFLVIGQLLAWLFLPMAVLFGGLAVVYFRRLMLKVEPRSKME